jgi:hypothetical protein
VNNRWVCKRCFADNDDTASACQRCGLIRGADSSAADSAQWAAESAPATAAAGDSGGWQRSLRFWWIPVVVIALAVGYFTTARRDDGGALSTSGTVTLEDLRVGDCFSFKSDATEINDVEGLPCSEPHESEVYAIANYSGAVYPESDAQLDQAIGDVCLPPFESYVGRSYEESVLFITAITPTEESWNDGNRQFICHLFEADDELLTESQRNADR